MTAMESVATHLDESTGYFVNHWQLLERIERSRRRPRCAHRGGRRRTLAPRPVAATKPPTGRGRGGRLRSRSRRDLHRRGHRAHRGLRAGAGDWRSQPESADYRLSLKRPLHTLKGGARMAGIMPMGDLSHELETLVMQVDNGTADRRRQRCLMPSRPASMSSRACASTSPTAAACPGTRADRAPQTLSRPAPAAPARPSRPPRPRRNRPRP